MARRNYKAGVILTGDSSGAVKAVEITRENMQKLNQELEKGSDRARKSGGSFTALGTSAAVMAKRVAAGAAAATAAIAAFTRVSDQLTNYRNRLKTVTDGIDNLNGVQEALVELSFRTRTSLADNIELFTRASAATENLGLSQQAVLELTESLSLGLQIGGATAAEASGAITQFTQGLALGRFETQELKSVLEQSVPIARALQKEFNATQGELLKMAESGELAAARVVEALRGDTLREFREEMESLQVTTTVGFNQLLESVTLVIGEFGRGVGVASSLGDGFNTMAQNISSVTDNIYLVGLAIQEALSVRFAQAAGIARELASDIKGVLFTIADFAPFADYTKEIEEQKANTARIAKETDAIVTALREKNLKKAQELGEKMVEIRSREVKAGQASIDTEAEYARKLNETAKSQENYIAQVERLVNLKLKHGLTEEAFTQQLEKLAKQYQVTGQAAEELAESNTVAAIESSNAWQDFGRTLEDAFVESFSRAGDSLDNFIDRVKTSFKEAAFRTLFQNTFGQLFGQTASGGSSGGFNLGGIVQTVGSRFNLGSFGSAFSSGPDLTTLAGVSGQQSGSGLFSSIGGASSAGILAGIVAGAIDIKNAEANGYTAGDVFLGRPNEDRLNSTFLGKIQPGILNPFTAIRKGIPGLADIISGIGGDGRKRFQGGIIAGEAGNPKSGNIVDQQRGASGLLITGVSNRIGDGGESTQSLVDAALGIDRALTDAFTSAGIKVDLTNSKLPGRSGQAGGAGSGAFFGQFGFNGNNIGTDLNTAADEFAIAWLNEVNELLPERVRRLTSGIDQVADELVNSVSAALQIDKLLNIDVVKQTEEALRLAGRTQAQAYEELTAAVHEANSALDGSADSLINLADVLTEQKNAAGELAAAYRNVGIEVDALLGNTIKNIRESLLSDEELYTLRRQEIADLNAQLSTAISPEEISRLAGEIDRLTNQAFNLLDDGQKGALQDEFITFLQGVADSSSSRIDAGLASLSDSETRVQQVIDTKESNQNLVELADTVEAVNAQFTQLLATLGLSSGGLNAPNLNIGSSEVNA